MDQKQGKAELCRPRLPVAMSNHPPVRDVWSAPRDLSAPRPRYRLQSHPRVGSPEPAPRPDHGPYLSSRCYDAALALAKLEPVSGGISGAKHPAGFTSRYCGDPARP